MAKRFGIRLAEGWLPCAEVTVPEVTCMSPYTVHHRVVKRKHGVTQSHAWNRALTWTREHGDPR